MSLSWETETKQFYNKQNGKDQPKVYFRLDDIVGDPKANVELTKATVREIDVSGIGITPTPSPIPIPTPMPDPNEEDDLTEVGIASASNNNAIDGLRSTSARISKGGKLTIQLQQAYKNIAALQIKFKNGPYKFKIENEEFESKKLENAFETFKLKKELETREINIVAVSDYIDVTTVKVYSDKTPDVVDPNPPPPPPVVVTPPLPPPTTVGFPIPPGFTVKGAPSTAFKDWGRTTTNYASGGSGPSRRWDNASLPNALNVVAGYEVNLGVKKGVRGEDNFDLKFRGSSHSDSNGGWYIPSISWGGIGQIGKEYPHPKTSHDKIQQPSGQKAGEMKGDFWVGFLAACFNDKKGVPTIMLWAKPKGKETNYFGDYVYLGKSKDTGNMKPGPVLDVIGKLGSKKQIIQVRMDEAPDAKIRNAFAVEVTETPE
jgi:hypothetical protein